jgi:hypothetical protein
MGRSRIAAALDVELDLCDPCGLKFGALQEVADMFNDSLSLESLLTDLCIVCRDGLMRAFGLV